MSRNGLAKILIADNDEEILLGLERALEDEGYSTATAISHGDASKMLSRETFDLIILDDYLSDKDATQLLTELQGSDVAPLVIVTYHRYPSRDDQARLLSLGVCALIDKHAYSVLVRKVDRLLCPYAARYGDEFENIT